MGKTFKINLFEKVKVQTALKLHGKSGEKDSISGKSAYEVKQYVGTKDPKVASRFDIFRKNGVTNVLHTLFKEGKGWVHKHWKV